MWKKIISIVCLLFLTGCATNPKINTASIKLGGENSYKSVRLTPSIYNHANADLSDIIIRDDKGEKVPYFINMGTEEIQEAREVYPLTLIHSYIKEDSLYFDYMLPSENNRDTISTSIDFATNMTDFVKEVEIYGSFDNIHWDFVQKDKLYSIDDKSSLTTEFIQPQKFTYYRLKICKSIEPFSLDGATLIYSMETSEKSYFTETLEPTFTVDSKAKQTTITIDGLNNLRLHDITLHSDSMFKRNIHTPQGVSKEIYNLALNDTVYNDTTIPIHQNASLDEAYYMTIDDGDDKPITIDKITVRYYAADLVFEGHSGAEYSLEFGKDTSKVAPVYDIERYKDEILKGTIDRAVIENIQYLAKAGTPKQISTIIFNIVIVMVVLLLATIILLKLKKK